MTSPLLSQPIDRLPSHRAVPVQGVRPQAVACVTGSVEDGAICVQLPFVGKKCLKVGANFANGLTASVCLERIFPPQVCAHIGGSKFCL